MTFPHVREGDPARSDLCIYCRLPWVAAFEGAAECSYRVQANRDGGPPTPVIEPPEPDPLDGPIASW